MTSPLSKTRLSRVAAVGITLALAGGLAACGSKSSDKPGAQSTNQGKTLVAVWPLTGQMMNGNEPNHPVMIVKVPNTAEATPQEGLAQADMISEELVEGGITRLAVYFDSKVPSLVGPVRSMRASDVGLVEPTEGMLVSSGAAAQTIGILNRDHQPFIQEDESRGYFRDSSRIAPYNLMTNLAKTATFFKVGTRYSGVPYKKTVARPQVFSCLGQTANCGYFQFPVNPTQVLGKKATSVSVKFSGFRTSQFSYRGGHYINTNDYTSGHPFQADNLLVIRVKEGNAGYLDPAGNPVPESILKGSGSMTLFHNGVAVTGTWSKANARAPFTFKLADGKQLLIPVGRTYLELCPIDSAGGNLSFK